METRHVSGSSIERLRAWLRSDMRTLRWVLLGLYVALLFGLLVFAVVQEVLGIGVVLLIMLGAQGLFIFGAGTIDLCRPIKRRRLVLPVIAAATMFTLLMLGLAIALLELFSLDFVEGELFPIVFWLAIGLAWIGWGILLYIYAMGWQRYQVLSRISRWLFAGSLLELLATVPSHLIVIRRPGCLVGLGTMLGIAAGLNVMLFSFGPMILVLFLRPQYRQEKAQGSQFCDTCGYDLRASIDRCPECGTPIAPPCQANSLDPKTR